MSYEYILFEVQNRIATITLNRPEQLNSLNLEIIEEMARALEECEKRRDIRVVVVTGAGPAFSAGDDIKIMSLAREMTAPQIAEFIERKAYIRVVKQLLGLPKPVIACVNGACLGAGGEMALACDCIIASNQASFGQLYVNVGLIGNTYLLPRAVGVKKALELIWSGQVISAEEAYQLGMISKVVVAANLLETTYNLARNLAQGPTLAMGLAKKAVYQGLSLDLDQGLGLMCQFQGELMKSEDHREGVKAFIEKRKPEFTGS